MEGQKQGGEGHQDVERTYTKLGGTERQKFRRRQIPFPTVQLIPAGDVANEVENNSSAIKIKISGEEYRENNNSRKRSREEENFRRPETRFATADLIPAGESADEVENNSSAYKIRRSASLRQENSENNCCKKRRSLSRENEKIKTLDIWISQLSDRVRARARADEADSAGAAEQFPRISISEEHVNNNNSCTVCLEAFEFGEDAREMPCTHIFHKKCIYEWLNRNPTCPLCRYNFLSPPSSAPKYNNSPSFSPHLSRSNAFSAYESHSKEFSASPSRRSRLLHLD